ELSNSSLCRGVGCSSWRCCALSSGGITEGTDFYVRPGLGSGSCVWNFLFPTSAFRSGHCFNGSFVLRSACADCMVGGSGTANERLPVLKPRRPAQQKRHFVPSTKEFPSRSLNMAKVPHSAFCGSVRNFTPLALRSRTVDSTSSVQ